MLRLLLNLNFKLFLSLFLLGTVTLAQGQSCPVIVQTALDATAEQCAALGRNQACYGNVKLEAVPRTGVNDFKFSAPGDIVGVNAIDSLTLSSQVKEHGTWGVAMMKLQASIPDTLPGQNITFLLFGDVQIKNGVDSSADAALKPMQAFYCL